MDRAEVNRSATRSCLIAAGIAVVIWLVISIATGASVWKDIFGALVVGIIAAAIALGVSIWAQRRAGVG